MFEWRSKNHPPPYHSKCIVDKGGLKIELLIKEIDEKEEYKSYLKLRNLHYRSKNIWGRTARLVVRNFHPLFPDVLGYIELGTSLYVNKPRSKILDTNFSFEEISWERWNMQTTRNNINIIVRISRLVVLPEFRGLGIGQLLVKAAMDFAKTHWQVGGLKPYFIEISADMLKYVPFAKRAGMLFVGETEGNLKRLWKDMAYLIRNMERVKNRDIVKEESSGIVDQQVARMNRTLKLMGRENLDFQEVIIRLKDLNIKKVLKDFDLFYQVISLPKPTYMAGLYPETHKFLLERLKEVPVEKNESAPNIKIQKLYDEIKLRKLSVYFDSKVRRTARTNTIQQAFGISPTDIRTKAIEDLTLNITPGEIVFITGPSGSGKTTLLNAIYNRNKNKNNTTISGEIHLPSNYDPGTFSKIHSEKAMIELFRNVDIPTSLYLMGLVGLSDAFVYLKRFNELSKGQQYRLLIALLIANKKNTWFIDEFCANLDTMTAMAVADGLQRLARRVGATVVVAASHYEYFVESLMPDKVVSISNSGNIEVMEGTKFLERVKQSKISTSIPTLKITENEFQSICNKKVTSVIIHGKKDYTNGPLLIQANEQMLLVTINSVEYRGSSIENDGIDDLVHEQEDLMGIRINGLEKNYKDKNIETIITIEKGY